MALTFPLAGPVRLRERWSHRARRAPTVLAPALPALILLAVTTAGTVDPPQGGLVAQLHVPPSVDSTYTPPSGPSFGITPR